MLSHMQVQQEETSATIAVESNTSQKTVNSKGAGKSCVFSVFLSLISNIGNHFYVIHFGE
jgi:hypothetical protein